MDFNNPAIPILGKTKELCKVCLQRKHPFNTRCNYEVLVARVKYLERLAANIPKLTEANREAVGIGIGFENSFKQLAEVLSLLEKTIKDHEYGGEIWDDFQKELEKRWPTSSPDTVETLENSSPKSTTPNETENKLSIVGTLPGETTAQDSSLLTDAVTRAENQPPLLTT